VHADLVVVVDILRLEADADADCVCRHLALTGWPRRRGRVGWLAAVAMGASSGSGDGEVRMQRPGGEGMREK
jgi:hypothetical protein